MNTTPPFHLTVISPVYDDAAAATRLLEHMDSAFLSVPVELRVIFVDDGSPTPLIHQLHPPRGFVGRVEVLRLRRNMGHQRAIALGLAHVHEHGAGDAVLVMDADGEDRPEDALRLLARFQEDGGARIVFAERSRRSESLLFKWLYHLYRLIHWLLTGINARVGNFSLVPASMLPALVTLPAMWNHYAAAIYQARFPRDLLPTARGTRYDGKSKMNLVALVMHGLQAISVFSDLVASRLLLAVCAIGFGGGILLVITLGSRICGGIELPFWAPYAAGAFLALTFSLALGMFSLTLTLLAQRNSLDFLPIRDYRYFVEGLHPVPPVHE